MRAAIPGDEALRLRALRAYDILDTPPEPTFDRLTGLAARTLGVPMALVTLVDADRQWQKSRFGPDVLRPAREASFCAHTILERGVLVVPDTLEDPRFADNPHVTGEPYVRFYAGVPLRTPDGQNLGAFAVLDTQPRAFGDEETKLLEDLAAIAASDLELRLTTQTLEKQAFAIDAALQEAERNRHLFERIAHTSPEVIYVLDLATRRNVYANRNAIIQLGYTQEQIHELGDSLLPAILHPEDLTKVMNHFAEFERMDDEACSEITYRIRDVVGGYRWLRARENVFSRHRDGRPKEILGVAADITELKQAEERLASLATTDELTGLANQRAFRERLTQLVAEGERDRRFALCLADIDHFKRINDTHGHPAGDRVLCAVGRALTTNVRRVDQVARCGGEEFSVLLVDVDEAVAAALAERLRQAVEAIPERSQVTASFGVAAYARGMSAEALIQTADELLYRAKQGGRNRVVRAEHQVRRVAR